MKNRLKTTTKFFSKEIVSVAAVDLRSLAFFRIALSLMLIVDIWRRIREAGSFIGENSVMPRSVAQEMTGLIDSFSLYTASDELFFQRLLLFIALFFAFWMLIGFKTRTATIISWVLLLSVQNRNLLILNSGDVLFRMALFWSMFLPLGARLSIDAVRLNLASRKIRREVSFASLAIIVQVCLLYFFAGVLKDGVDWTEDYTATYYALHLEQFTTFIGEFIFNQYELTRAMTVSVWYLEVFVSVLILFPIFNRYTRLLAVIILFGLQLGFGTSMHLGIFPWISVAMLIPLLPSMFWETLKSLQDDLLWKNLSKAKLTWNKKEGRYQYFIKLVAFIIIPTKVDIISDQSGRDVVLTLGTEKITGLEKITMHLLKRSRVWFFLYPVTLIDPLYDGSRWLYYKIQPKQFKQYRNTNEHFIGFFIKNLLALLALTIVLMWNMQVWVESYELPKDVQTGAKFIGLNQNWGMFAPNPLKVDGWYVVQGTYVGETESEFLYESNGITTTFEKPENVSSTFENSRWRKYLSNIQSERHAPQRTYLARHWCYEYSDEDRQLGLIKIWYMNYTSQLNYKHSETRQRLIIEHQCEIILD